MSRKLLTVKVLIIIRRALDDVGINRKVDAVDAGIMLLYRCQYPIIPLYVVFNNDDFVFACGHCDAG